MEAAQMTSDAELTPHRRKLRIMLRNRRWLAANIEELMANYKDRWIVVADQSVIGSGDTSDSALAACGRKIDEIEAIVLLVPREIHRPI